MIKPQMLFVDVMFENKILEAFKMAFFASWNWHIHATNSRGKKNMDIISVEIWSSLQVTSLDRKSKVQHSEYDILPFVYKKEKMVSTELIYV